MTLEEDVLGLEVAVEDVEQVHVPQGAAELHEDAQHLVLLETPPRCHCQPHYHC